MMHRPAAFCCLVLFLLSACGGGGGGSSDTPATTPPPPVSQAPDPGTKLLSDAELLLPVEASNPAVAPDWSQWLVANHKPLRSIEYDGDFSDLAFLDNLLAGKRIVQLGEHGHGVAEFNKVKTRLIKYLHQKLGYEVLAFESCLFDANYYNAQASALNAQSWLTESILGVWHTQEVLRLFDYAKGQQTQAKPLIIAGFDTQHLFFCRDAKMPEFLAGLAEHLDPAMATRLRQELIADLQSLGQTPDTDAKMRHILSMRPRLDSYAEFFASRFNALKAAMPERSRDLLLARQLTKTLLTEVARAEAHLAGDVVKRLEIRDAIMAENVRFLAEDYWPGKKIMIWAHNTHIMHQAAALEEGYRAMGTHVSAHFRDQLYTIGLYSYKGRGNHNSRQVYSTSVVTTHSLEAVFGQIHKRYSFLDLTGTTNHAGTQWLYDPTLSAKAWGLYDDKMQLKAQYDGILFIHDITPSVYLPAQ